jgi:hypothetical protein
MSRASKFILGIGSSLLFDGLLLWIVYRQARSNDATPSVYWWSLTISLAVFALLPLIELARQGRLLERVLAGFLSCVPVGWVGLCVYVAYH